jgi:hypothetical protein
MSWPFNLEQAEDRPRRRKTSQDEMILPGNCHTNGWGLEGERPLRECLSDLTNQERLGCDVTVGSPPLDVGGS